MKMLSVTLKDLQLFLRDRGAVMMLFLLPLIFIAGIALIAGNESMSGSSATVQKLPLVVVNQDADGEAATAILAGIESSEKISLKYQDFATTEKQLNSSALRHALIIPKDFSANLAAGRKVELRLLIHPIAEENNLITVERAIQRASREYLMMVYLNKGLQQMAEMQAASPQSQEAFSEANIQEQVAQQQAMAEERPLIKVVEIKATKKTGRLVLPSYAQYVVLGMAVMFVFLGAQNTAESIFREKKLGSFRRLMAAPISKAALLGGKLLPNLILSTVQIAVIFFTGGYLVQFIGVDTLDLSTDPFGLIVVSLVTALCSTCLGILIASLAKTEGQVGGLSTVLLFVAAMLGGSFIPLFIFSPALGNIGRFLPHYWANQAFYGLVFRGQTLAVLWPNVLVLLVFTLAFFGIGLWRFKFE